MNTLTARPNFAATCLTFSALVLFLVLTAGAVTRAEPEYCSEVCNPGFDCDRECYVPGSGYMTCGEAGYCSTGGGCTPNWVPVSSTPVYAFANNHVVPNDWCEFIVQYKYNYTDTNNCGQSPPLVCYYSTQGTEQGHVCCSWYVCGGTPC